MVEKTVASIIQTATNAATMSTDIVPTTSPPVSNQTNFAATAASAAASTGTQKVPSGKNRGRPPKPKSKEVHNSPRNFNGASARKRNLAKAATSPVQEADHQHYQLVTRPLLSFQLQRRLVWIFTGDPQIFLIDSELELL